ncbi:hypothetical protein ES706_00751 [subsurface metagenome]|nr:hypothetical protein [Hadesarchaea archaeon]
MGLNATFRKISRQLDMEFGELSTEIPHRLKSGEARENVLRKFLTKYLPQRVGIEQGFVIDAQGQKSKQTDVVIYDKTVATVFDINGVKYFPCEIVLAVGEVKSDINSRRELGDALNKIKSVKKLDRSNQGKNLILTGPGISLKGIKFDPLTQHRDQILGFIFTRTSMNKETILEALREYNSRMERRLWLNLFCAYKNFLISYESNEKGLTSSAMDADRMYCTIENEIPNLVFLFTSILATFINEAHIARPNYFEYANIATTMHTDHPLTTSKGVTTCRRAFGSGQTSTRLGG